jgi:transcriptional regulator with XRE-family HTH domain
LGGLTSSHLLIKRARGASGLTQQQLAERAGTTQSTIARLERADADPRLSTLTRILAASGHQLELSTSALPAASDTSQLRERLALSPAERLSAFTAAHRNLAELVAGARHRA